MTSQKTPLKVGVLGTGAMGRNHLRVLSTMSQFELVGCFDTNQELNNSCADTYHIKAFDDAESLCNEVDLVHIVAPSFLHRDLTILAANKGCHVMVEKPIALNVSDAKEMVDQCRSKNVKLCVGHVERFNPAIMSLSSIIASEELISADFRRMSPFYSRVSDASVIMDLMIHDVDVLNAMCNEPIKHIAAQGACIYTDKIDYAQALITFESGKMASLTASRVTESKIRSAQINTKNAFIDVDYLARSVEISRKTNFTLDVGYPVQYTQENIVEKVFVPLEEPLRAEFAHFADSIVNDTPIAPSGEMGQRALGICCEIESLIVNS